MFTNQQPYQPKMLPTGEAAKRLHVSAQTVRDWTASGKLAATLTGGGHRQYREDDVAYLALGERGITTYWMDDVIIQMDGQLNVTVLGKGLAPYVASDPTEELLARYQNFHNGLEVIPRNLALTGQPKVLAPTKAETVLDDEGNLIVQTYLSVFTLDKQSCERILEEQIPLAVSWLSRQVRPVHGVAQWLTQSGERVQSAY